MFLSFGHSMFMNVHRAEVLKLWSLGQLCPYHLGTPDMPVPGPTPRPLVLEPRGCRGGRGACRGTRVFQIAFFYLFKQAEHIFIALSGTVTALEASTTSSLALLRLRVANKNSVWPQRGCSVCAESPVLLGLLSPHVSLWSGRRGP